MFCSVYDVYVCSTSTRLVQGTINDTLHTTDRQSPLSPKVSILAEHEAEGFAERTVCIERAGNQCPNRPRLTNEGGTLWSGTKTPHKTSLFGLPHPAPYLLLVNKPSWARFGHSSEYMHVKTASLSWWSSRQIGRTLQSLSGRQHVHYH
jgi:hypothetical protein